MGVERIFGNIFEFYLLIQLKFLTVRRVMIYVLPILIIKRIFNLRKMFVYG